MERFRDMRSHHHHHSLPVGSPPQPLEDYWQECNSFEESCHPDEDEDEATKTPDEAEAEEEWLREAGFENLVENVETTDDSVFDELLFTLTARQRAVVQKHLQSFQMSKKKKKHNKNKQRADVREVFNHPGYSENATDSDQTHHGTKCHVPLASSSPPCSVEFQMNKPPMTYTTDSSAISQQDEPHKNFKSSSSVLPPFLRTGHSGGFSLSHHHHHNKGIDTESPTSVEVLRYESRKSTIQEPESFSDDAKSRLSPELPEISFQGIASRLDPCEDYVPTDRQNLIFTSLPSSRELSGDLQIAQDGYEEETPHQSETAWKDHIPVNDLNEEDRTLVRSLAVIEVAALLDSHGLVPCRSRKRKRKKGKENVVLGTPLAQLLDLDRRRCPGLKLPLIYQWVFHHLHDHGLEEEGLMRLAGSVQKIEALKSEIERSYVASPGQVESAIRQSSVHDVAVLLKQLVRHLQEPLLTNCHMDTFLQVPNIPVQQDQIAALNLLVLALPDVHRELLEELLYFLGKIVANEERNRMTVANVAMIMAPNLFPPPRLKKSHHKSSDLATEVTVAALSSKVTQLLIKYGHFLGMVPKNLLAQARLQAQHSSKKHVKRTGGRKTKAEKVHLSCGQYHNPNHASSIIKVHVASYRNPNGVPVTIDEQTTAGEVVEKVASVMEQVHDYRGVPSFEHEGKAWLIQRQRTTSEPLLIRQRCLLGQRKPNENLKDHYLYHIVENSGEKMLDHGMTILRTLNGTHSLSPPKSYWEVRCHH